MEPEHPPHLPDLRNRSTSQDSVESTDGGWIAGERVAVMQSQTSLYLVGEPEFSRTFGSTENAVARHVPREECGKAKLEHATGMWAS